MDLPLYEGSGQPQSAELIVFKIRVTISIRLPSGQFPPASYSAALKSVVGPLKEQTADAFARERDPVTGQHWAKPKQPLVPAGRKLLDKTGLLKQRTLSAATRAIITGNTLVIRQRLPHYAKYHNTGTIFMKRRRSLGAGPKIKAILAKALKREGVKLFVSPRPRGG